jgi:hypothetical protein
MGDPDQHPEVVLATIQMLTASVCAQLDKLAELALQHPEITAEQALLDASSAIRRAADEMMTYVGGQITTTRQ